MYNTVWNMEDLDLEYAKTDINCGTDLMFYIEMDPPDLIFFKKRKFRGLVHYCCVSYLIFST
ncbi:hypothetical protein FD754_011224 [Muntiacus muntjak]|nr:hypothetical protein FD754_011224 [Muntiacus muntjak]